MRERIVGLAVTHSYAYYRRILSGVARIGEQHPEWRFVSLSPSTDKAKVAEFKHVDVAIVDVSSRELCDTLEQMHIRVINVACVVPDLPIPRVGVDNRTIGRLAAEHLIGCGLQSFAFVGHPSQLASLEREHSFRNELKSHGHQLAVYHSSLPALFDASGCERSLDEGVGPWLKSLPRPTGVLTPNDLWGVEVAEICRRERLRIPDDIAVLGVDDDDLFCMMSRPPLSSVIVPAEAIGRCAALLAEELMSSRRRNLKHDVLIPTPGVTARLSTDVLAVDDPNVAAAIRFVRANCHRPLRVADVLREVPVGRRWLERRVAEALGNTLGNEIRRSRLERAQRLLAETDMTIAEVAAQTGFKDYRHMSVTFRKTLGQTPTQFRQVTCRPTLRFSNPVAFKNAGTVNPRRKLHPG